MTGTQRERHILRVSLLHHLTESCRQRHSSAFLHNRHQGSTSIPPEIVTLARILAVSSCRCQQQLPTHCSRPVLVTQSTFIEQTKYYLFTFTISFASCWPILPAPPQRCLGSYPYVFFLFPEAITVPVRSMLSRKHSQVVRTGSPPRTLCVCQPAPQRRPFALVVIVSFLVWSWLKKDQPNNPE